MTQTIKDPEVLLDAVEVASGSVLFADTGQAAKIANVKLVLRAVGERQGFNLQVAITEDRARLLADWLVEAIDGP